MKRRNNFNANFKAKMACEALRENKTLNELASEHGVHQTQIAKWKKVLLEECTTLFERKNSVVSKSDNSQLEELQRIVGEQAIQIAWYKKKFGNFN